MNSLTANCINILFNIENIKSFAFKNSTPKVESALFQVNSYDIAVDISSFTSIDYIIKL